MSEGDLKYNFKRTIEEEWQMKYKCADYDDMDIEEEYLKSLEAMEDKLIDDESIGYEETVRLHKEMIESYHRMLNDSLNFSNYNSWYEAAMCGKVDLEDIISLYQSGSKDVTIEDVRITINNIDYKILKKFNFYFDDLLFALKKYNEKRIKILLQHLRNIETYVNKLFIKNFDHLNNTITNVKMDFKPFKHTPVINSYNSSNDFTIVKFEFDSNHIYKFNLNKDSEYLFNCLLYQLNGENDVKILKYSDNCFYFIVRSDFKINILTGSKNLCYQYDGFIEYSDFKLANRLFIALDDNRNGLLTDDNFSKNDKSIKNIDLEKFISNIKDRLLNNERLDFITDKTIKHNIDNVNLYQWLEILLKIEFHFSFNDSYNFYIKHYKDNTKIDLDGYRILYNEIEYICNNYHKFEHFFGSNKAENILLRNLNHIDVKINYKKNIEAIEKYQTEIKEINFDSIVLKNFNYSSYDLEDLISKEINNNTEDEYFLQWYKNLKYYTHIKSMFEFEIHKEFKSRMIELLKLNGFEIYIDWGKLIIFINGEPANGYNSNLLIKMRTISLLISDHKEQFLNFLINEINNKYCDYKNLLSNYNLLIENDNFNSTYLIDEYKLKNEVKNIYNKHKDLVFRFKTYIELKKRYDEIIDTIKNNQYQRLDEILTIV